MDDSANLQHKTPSITFPSLFKSFLLLPLEVTKVYREGSHFSPSKQWLQTVYVAWINTWISLGPIYDKRVNMRECEHLLRAETSPVKAANSRLMTDFTCRQKQTEHRVILFFTTATNVRQTDSITAFTGGLVGIQWQMLNIKSLSSSEENSVSASSSSNWCYSSVFLLQAHLFPDTSGHCGFQQTLLKQERTVNLSGTFISVGWTRFVFYWGQNDVKSGQNKLQGVFLWRRRYNSAAHWCVFNSFRTRKDSEEEEKNRISPDLNLTFGV